MAVANAAIPRPPLRWGRILLCALLSALIALGLIYVCVTLMPTLPDPVMTVLCPNQPSTGDSYGDLLSSALGCMFAMVVAGTLAYFVLALIISAILIQFQIRSRRLGHSLLSALFSVPIAYLILWLAITVNGALN